MKNNGQFMKICIFTLGTRGDVQPYVALAKAAVQQGHRAVICTGESFCDLIQKNGVEFCRTESDLMAFAQTEMGKAILQEPLKNMKLAMRASKEILNPAYRKTLDNFFVGAKDADVILYHPKALGAVDIALHYGIPCVSMPPVPVTYPIEEFPNLALTKKNLGKQLNRLTYLVNSKAESGQISEINNFREKTLGLPPRRAGVYTYQDGTKEIPTIYPISSTLFPNVKSWDGHVFLPGFFFLDSDEELPADIEAFLSSGKPPIVITFSSMPVKNQAEFIRNLETALHETNNRAILLTGSSGIRLSADSEILAVDAAPHDLLFPRAKGILHHGGVGTMASALRSGVPQAIMPLSADQPFWADHLYRLGYTQKPLSWKNVSVKDFTNLFAAFDETGNQENAIRVGKVIQSENGVMNALRYLEKLVESV